MSSFDLSVLFFLQMAVILATCRAVGALARRIGQPPVVSEMIAGVVLGPSLFRAALPEWHGLLFPRQSMTIIFAVAQLGLAVYMFLVGVEFRADLIRQRLSSALSVSAAGILAPFTLGSLIALLIHADASMFTPTVGPARRSSTWARRCRSPHSPCSRASFTSAGSPAPRWARWRWRRGRWTMRRRGACSRSSWGASATLP